MARRLYCPQINTGTTTIIGPEAHHGRDVLRLKPGDPIELFDGKGHYAPATVESLSKSQICFHLGERIHSEPTPFARIALATAIPKFAHQETLVRMCTEIGVSVFFPVVFDQSSVREQCRIEKWRRWALEACKQSGNNFLPEIREPIHFKDLLKTEFYEIMIYGEAQSDQRIDWAEKLQGAMNVMIWVGPEGGFTSDEKQMLELQQAHPLRIGRHVLRIETAAVVLSAFLSHYASK